MKPNRFQNRMNGPARFPRLSAPPALNTALPAANRQERGVALVITLIMLAMVTFMATAFLVLSRRERGVVKVSVDQTTAALMAQTASDQAIAQTVGAMLARSNLFHYDLMVSTNFINPRGFVSGIIHPTNVSYYRRDGSPITNNVNDYLRNLANLYYQPRPPVFYPTYRSNNLSQFASNDFRFYYDLNQNERFEDTGLLMVLNNSGRAAGFSNYFVGDPQWIGVLEQLNAMHSASNRFIGRYAFVVLPSGKTLDLNYIHNQAKWRSRSSSPSALNRWTFSRNQGVGSWEINLGAFLRDLNTNIWPNYSYSQEGQNTGEPFWDAYSLIRYRANDLGNASNTLGRVFALSAPNILTRDSIDQHADGPFDGKPDDDRLDLFWAGSENGTNYYDVQQLLSLPTAPDGINMGRRIQGRSNPPTRNSSYDRYTFYRLLAQLGVDSKPSWNNKIHLNYRNDTGFSPTNLIRWTPIAFFTNAADRILRSQFNLSVTNIPVYPMTNRQYNAAVHRLLQVAANIFDATTNSQLPSVFRPIYGKSANNAQVYITGYRYEPTYAFLARPWRDLDSPADRNALQPEDNVFGVPVVIGAKKYYPNFNEATMQTVVDLTRKLEVVKRVPTSQPIATNQMYILGISNVFGIEGWNSYSNDYRGRLELRLTNLVTMALVTSNRMIWPPNGVPLIQRFVAPPAKADIQQWSAKEFDIHLMTNVIFLSNAVYSSVGTFRPIIPAQFQLQADILNVTNPVILLITNRFQYILIDRASSRVVDMVNMEKLVTQVNLTQELTGNNAGSAMNNIERTLWDSRMGMTNQIQVSLGNEESRGIWNAFSQDPVSGDNKDKSIDRFRVFMGLAPINYPNATTEMRPATSAQTPFNPTRKFLITSSLQVNDPLVHYTLEDLVGGRYSNQVQVIKPPTRALPASNLGLLNEKFRPWGGNPGKDTANDQTAYSLAFKDPQIRKSDDWSFPTNLFPNIGWLGQVHRGTPWQTVYLKSTAADVQRWTLDWATRAETHPTNDWWLVDLFTTAINENASRGLLSVNQTNLAAWSAALSSVGTVSNASPKAVDVLVQPASPQIRAIVDNINATRASLPFQAFSQLGHVLATPALTVNSPFLAAVNTTTDTVTTDKIYERMPQQVLSLLKSDEPRLVIYALGQSLRPAPNSLVLEPGSYYRMCTNYEVSAEVASKTVLRIEGPPANPRVITESYNLLPSE